MLDVSTRLSDQSGQCEKEKGYGDAKSYWIGIHKTFYNKKLSYKKGETAYTLLKRSKLKLKTKGFGPFLYVSSINGLAEKTHGNLSGWMYKVGKKAPNVGANAYKLKANMKVTWYYVNY